jgi:hypothetical protein
MPVHAERECLERLRQHPRIERAQRRAGVTRKEPTVGDERWITHDRAAEDATLSVDVLGG